MCDKGLVDNSEQVALAQDEQFLAIQFDFRARVLGKQHDVTGFYIHGDALAVLVTVTRSSCNHRTASGVFLWQFRGAQCHRQ